MLDHLGEHDVVELRGHRGVEARGWLDLARVHLAQRVEGAHAAHLPAGITHKVRVGELQQADDGHGTYANATAVPPGQYR